MTLEELKEKLTQLGIPDGWLSVNGPDSVGATIIYYNYNQKWRVYQIADPGRSAKCSFDEMFVTLEAALDYAHLQAQKEAKYYNPKLL